MNTKLGHFPDPFEKTGPLLFRTASKSGLSVNDYCSQHQLSRDAYYYWLRKNQRKPACGKRLCRSGTASSFSSTERAQPSDSKEMMQIFPVSTTFMFLLERRIFGKRNRRSFYTGKAKIPAGSLSDGKSLSLLWFQ